MSIVKAKINGNRPYVALYVCAPTCAKEVFQLCSFEAI